MKHRFERVQSFSIAAILTMVSLAASSCSFRSEKGALKSQVQEPGTALSFALVQQKVFAPYCVSCHGNSGGVNLESYSSVRSSLDQIRKAALTEKRMPPGGSLPAEASDLLAKWLDAGAPEMGSDPLPSAQPSAPPAPDAIQATYIQLRRSILEPKCLGCHSTGGVAEKVPLGTWKDLTGAPGQYVIPGKPDQSPILKAMRGEDGALRMPPASSGLPALSPQEIEAFRKWIEIGAPEGDNPTPRSSQLPQAGVSYAMVRDLVIGPRCVSCHGNSGGVNLETYDSLKANLPAVESAALVQKIMPPGAPLTDDQAKLLGDWIRAGAPEGSDTPGSPQDPDPGKHPGKGKPQPEPEPIPVPPPPPPPLPPPPSGDVNYATVNAKIFQPYCVSCHGSAGGVNLETYAEVKNNLARTIVAVLDDKRMPPGRTLSDDEIDLLSRWVRAGAPETSNPVPNPSPSPSPSPAPVKVTFGQVRAKTLEPRCLTCHQQGSAAEKIPLGTAKDLLGSNNPLVIKGDPEKSPLFISITRNDTKRMPPESRKIPDDEIELIRKWIAQGAVE